jgi:hypothetical protein
MSSCCILRSGVVVPGPVIVTLDPLMVATLGLLLVYEILPKLIGGVIL